MANHGVSVILAADLPLFTSIIAMDSVSVRSGEDAGRAEWSIRSGAIPASPTSSRRRIPEAVSMDNDGTVGIFVGDIVKTSPGGRILGIVLLDFHWKLSRVILVVGQLGWIELDFRCSTIGKLPKSN